MRRTALVSVLALGAVLAPAPASAAPQVEQVGDAARARELYLKGREEMKKEGRLPQAYAYLHEAWTLQKSFDTAGNLALVESNLTRYREAAEHATYALAHYPTGGSAAQHKQLEEVLAAARAQVGTVTVKVSADRATVTIDNQPVGESPLANDVFLEPGNHTLVATVPGCEPARDTVLARKGGSHLVTLTLGKCGGPNVPPPLVPVEPTGPRPLTIAGFVATGVALGVGTGLAIMAKVKASDADGKLPPGAGPSFCATSSPQCTALHDALASHDTFSNAAIWTFVTAGVLGAGTLVYTFAVPRSPATAAPRAARAQVIPVVGPGTGALTLKGTF